jgi:hypothetical protein
METLAPICPYCGKEKSDVKGPKCLFCKMVLGTRYIIYIDGDKKVSNLCSVRCLDLLEETIKSNEGEDVSGEEDHDPSRGICPLCGLKTLIDPIEAKSVCRLCGMLIARDSSEYVIREKSSYFNFCCSRCLKVFNETRGLKLNKHHFEDRPMKSGIYDEAG